MAISPPKDLGYNRELYIMPFDHRGSFEEKLFGIKGRPPSETEVREISSYKRIVYHGFKKAVAAGVPKEKAGILVDEQFGADILRDAKAEGFITACPAEKSGQQEFQLEYGAEFGAHIAKFDPAFVKVLVRYNPEANAELNRRQAARLKQLSEYCHAHGNKLMFELLIPATKDQLSRSGGDFSRYDRELRPGLMVEVIGELQDAGVEPDVWKLEGLELPEDFRRVVEQAKARARSDVGVIVLGRGESAERVKHWLRTGAQVPGVTGFAVGRTIFWEPLKGVKEGKLTPGQAEDQVARNYKFFCDLWAQARRNYGAPREAER